MPDILFDWFSKYRNEHEDNLRVLHGFTESVITTRRQQMHDDKIWQDVSKAIFSHQKSISFLLDPMCLS